LTSRDLLIVLLSGGASSLLAAPANGLTLADEQTVTNRLLRCGANIQEINTVRKHLSSVKGGRMSELTDATIVTLILSDVPGDDLSAIGSGPTVPDPSTYDEAVMILKRYRLWRSIPPRVRQHLSKGQQGYLAETPKPGSSMFRRVHHHLIGSNTVAVAAVRKAARASGLRTLVHTSFTGNAAQAGVRFGRMARRLATSSRSQERPCCIVAGGETTVVVTGKGQGGRAQEFAVAAAREIAGLQRVWIAAIGTDGTDGPTDVAGAVVDENTFTRAKDRGIDLDAALARHDTYPALKRLGSHIVTGPTGTNVNDLYLLLVL
jgi:glycerate-2-kinase